MADSPIAWSLHDPETLPVLDTDALISIGTTVIIAPHPDDESLGCGGLIALLTQFGNPVRVIVMSDGVGSHRNSREYPEDRLRALRQEETIAAVETLGLPRENIAFLDLPDQYVPVSGSSGFSEAVDACYAAMTENEFAPETLVLPWRRDPHCDHAASWWIARAASAMIDRPLKILEYAVWLAELGDAAAWPTADEARVLRVDVASVLQRKRNAIDCHRSQTTDLINDDPDGFCLSTESRSRFDASWEVFLEPLDEQ